MLIQKPCGYSYDGNNQIILTLQEGGHMHQIPIPFLDSHVVWSLSALAVS